MHEHINLPGTYTTYILPWTYMGFTSRTWKRLFMDVKIIHEHIIYKPGRDV